MDTHLLRMMHNELGVALDTLTGRPVGNEELGFAIERISRVRDSINDLMAQEV